MSHDTTPDDNGLGYEPREPVHECDAAGWSAKSMIVPCLLGGGLIVALGCIMVSGDVPPAYVGWAALMAAATIIAGLFVIAIPFLLLSKPMTPSEYPDDQRTPPPHNE